ncbi:hypothetical protein AB0M02_00270 [Actinoplanes sp. NPDC051861]|uniref:hypothetical protein n=1 Tax=Actinoplanes sp. NPDC051861 TaxID=3155170 RepID=UPI0034294B47
MEDPCDDCGGVDCAGDCQDDVCEGGPGCGCFDERYRPHETVMAFAELGLL